MKAMKNFKRLISIMMAAAIALLSVNIFTVAQADGGVLDEIPYTAHDASVSAYNCASMDVYTESEAAAAGVPAGYSGYVMKVTSAASGASGITVDFSGRSIDVSDVLSFSIRVYYPGNTSQVRITKNAGASWVKMYNGAAPGTWDEISLTSSEIAQLADSSGKLGKFNLGFRFSNTAVSVTYIDYVTVVTRTGFEAGAKEEIHFTDFDQSVNGLAAPASVEYYDETTGAAAGVPSGYTGYVMKLVSNGAASVATTIDFTDMAIPVNNIESLTFRVYYTDAVQAGNGIRLSYSSSAWATLLPPSSPNTWTEVVITDSGVLSTLSNSAGNLGKFGFGFRLSAAMTAYIDSVVVTQKAPPVTELAESDPTVCRDEIPYGPHDGNYAAYNYFSMKVYNETNGALAGVPAGYTGYVMKISTAEGGGSVGITVDFTDRHIMVSDIESINMRVYYPSNTQASNGVRVSYNPSSWVALLPPSNPNAWDEIVIPVNSGFQYITNTDGTLGKFGVGFRVNPASGVYDAYIDYVSVTLKTVTADYPESDPAVCRNEIPYADVIDRTIAPYIYDTMSVYTVQNGALSGVPAGYTGYVMKLVSGTEGSVGHMIDFSSRGIPVSLVESVNMRVWSPALVREVRVSVDGGTGWVLRHEPAVTGDWEEISITGASDIAKLANGGSTLGKFGLGMRFTSFEVGTVYIDYVTATLKPDDGLAPVISYSGSTDIVTTAGKPLVLDVTAADNLEGEIPVVWTWSQGAVDGNGRLLEGQHTLTLTATDFYGNSSSLTVNLTVGPQDLEAPEIDFALTEINSVVGALPRFAIDAVDNTDSVEAVITWSAGALDNRGRLTAGTHTMTVTATDLSGNTTALSVTVNVTAAFTTDKPVTEG